MAASPEMSGSPVNGALWYTTLVVVSDVCFSFDAIVGQSRTPAATKSTRITIVRSLRTLVT